MVPLPLKKRAAVFDQFFSWSFWSSSTLPRLVVLRCVVLHFVVCFVLCCVVMCCDVSYLLLYFVGLKFLSFPVPSLHDLTQQLDGCTTVRPTRRLNKQNFHCVFFKGKHRFLRGIFGITTFCVPSVAVVKFAKISSLSLASAF